MGSQITNLGYGIGLNDSVLMQRVKGAGSYEEGQKVLASAGGDEAGYSEATDAVNNLQRQTPFTAPDLTDDAVKRARIAGMMRFAQNNPGFLTGPLGLGPTGAPTTVSAPKLVGS